MSAVIDAMAAAFLAGVINAAGEVAADLSRAVLARAHLHHVGQTDAEAKDWLDGLMTPGEIVEAYAAGRRDFRDAILLLAALPRANMAGADLSNAGLVAANLSSADLSRADLRGAELRDADLQDSDLRGADLRDANLGGADMRGAKLTGANLGSANLARSWIACEGLRGAIHAHAAWAWRGCGEEP